MATQLRLQKYIADCGITSRRKAEDLIVQGRVKINGVTVTELGSKVNLGEDIVFVDGQTLSLDHVQRIYVVLNKPRAFMTTLNDPEGRQTVMDLLKEFPERIYPVGRLDYLSEGLLILTNDGDVANMIIHPSNQVTKVYEVKVFGVISQDILRKLRNGVQTEEGFLKPKAVRVIKQMNTKTWLEFRLTGGKNREIRRICEAVGLTVDKLRRIAIGGLTVDKMGPGKYRTFTKRQLLEEIGMDTNGRLIKDKEFQSSKKTVKLTRRSLPEGTLADDPNFQVYRKETYFTTIKTLEQRKKEEAKQERREAYEAKEEAHQKRVIKKKNRQRKKEAEKAEKMSVTWLK
ncbi:MAG: pseudouridine synthase [Deltaproteobacteria bacterium]|nr:MAG: pseudouridine synthase [Deltaproteobacteria bacterium]TNF27227.1 MAG: pseudouridine synthase [Deltaproteobacteria bacterium]